MAASGLDTLLPGGGTSCPAGCCRPSSTTNDSSIFEAPTALAVALALALALALDSMSESSPVICSLALHNWQWNSMAASARPKRGRKDVDESVQEDVAAAATC